jgi:hypothetical protein
MTMLGRANRFYGSADWMKLPTIGGAAGCYYHHRPFSSTTGAVEFRRSLPAPAPRSWGEGRAATI